MRNLLLNVVMMTAIGMTATPAAAAGEGLDEARVEGSLDKDLIRRIVRAHIGEIRHCYNEGLQRDPKLAGKVIVEFTIAATGKVSHSEVATSTVPDDAVGTCIAAAAGRWLFPKPEGGAPVQVTYPFVLEPG